MEVRSTPQFSEWLNRLRDRTARKRILSKLDLVRHSGHLGVTRSVGAGVSEMKLDFGPGYHLYYTLRDAKLILLLIGGDKSSQAQDILDAKRLSRQIE